MSLVNAFHVYSSRDLSRERKKERRLSEDPNLTRIVSIRTSTTEELFHQPSFPHSFLECYFLISSKKKKKITRESFLHVFFHTPNVEYIFLRGEEVDIEM